MLYAESGNLDDRAWARVSATSRIAGAIELSLCADAMPSSGEFPFTPPILGKMFVTILPSLSCSRMMKLPAVLRSGTGYLERNSAEALPAVPVAGLPAFPPSVRRGELQRTGALTSRPGFTRLWRARKPGEGE
jgi:hypothetical protein